MPAHDWTRVEAGIFHHFHHSWIEEVARAMNNGVLPEDYYAMAEQHAAGFGPDVLTLQDKNDSNGAAAPRSTSSGPGGTATLTSPQLTLTGETDMAFYRRKRKPVVVRHVSGDRIVAMVEVVSPSNKNSKHGVWAFVEMAAELLDNHIHLLTLDLFPPGPRDPQGMHAEIWDAISGEEYKMPDATKPLALASYEAGLAIRAYVVLVAVGDAIIDMPLYLEEGQYVNVPLEATCQAAFAAVPRRWRRVLEA